MSSRSFTIDQANALVPVLEERFSRVLLLRVELKRAYARLEQAGLALDEESLAALTDLSQIGEPQGRCLALGLALAQELKAIAATGVQVKDPEQGLCDFASERDGRVVLLCWKLGEPAVAHWHEVEAGFAGRQPLDVHPEPRLLS